MKKYLLPFLKTILPFLFTLLLIFICEEIFARAGGGGGGGGHSGGGGGGGYHYGRYHGYGYGHGRNSEEFGAGGLFMIIFLTGLIWGLVAFAFTGAMIFRAMKTKKIIKKANKIDTVWDEERMKKWSAQMFKVMQDAWMNRDMDAVKPLTSEILYAKYSMKLDNMKRAGHVNIIKNIKIDSVRIISAFDSRDNNADKFTAYIKGDILDYTLHEKTRGIIINPDKDIEDFEDFYHFQRKGDVWLLEDITNDPDTADIRRKEKEYN